MSLRRRQRFVTGNIAWMLAAVVVLIVLNSFSFELFFVISLIGFLIVTELTAPIATTPAWRRRLYVVIVLGLAVFAYIVIQRILAILPEGLL